MFTFERILINLLKKLEIYHRFLIWHIGLAKLSFQEDLNFYLFTY